MSRIGKTPIKKPSGVSLKTEKGFVEIKGPKGVLKQTLMEGISVEENGEEILVSLLEKPFLHKKFHGLYRALVNNMVQGVSQGFQKRLVMIGVGFRAELQGTKLKLQVGYSNPIVVDIPEGIQMIIEKPTIIVVTGIDKQRVGWFAALLRDLRPPEPYKGKGIRYEGEYVRKKAGKGAKAK